MNEIPGNAVTANTPKKRYESPQFLSMEPLEAFATGCADSNEQSGPGKTSWLACLTPLGS
ncbi:hypothetical protein [uncultured Thiodictyon sp.]|uniref:hypothetical protein n=1 Tax=uncultured Thiodictyon sp. TaxID=1846217 RepID=UPI0025F20BEE|nr:hypothetical protein [uncultured Thiodictyon sp.]